MARLKQNKKRIDPRHHLNEKQEKLNEQNLQEISYAERLAQTQEKVRQRKAAKGGPSPAPEKEKCREEGEHWERDAKQILDADLEKTDGLKKVQSVLRLGTKSRRGFKDNWDTAAQIMSYLKKCRNEDLVVKVASAKSGAWFAASKREHEIAKTELTNVVRKVDKIIKDRARKEYEAAQAKKEPATEKAAEKTREKAVQIKKTKIPVANMQTQILRILNPNSLGKFKGLVAEAVQRLEEKQYPMGADGSVGRKTLTALQTISAVPQTAFKIPQPIRKIMQSMNKRLVTKNAAAIASALEKAPKLTATGSKGARGDDKGAALASFFQKAVGDIADKNIAKAIQNARNRRIPDKKIYFIIKDYDPRVTGQLEKSAWDINTKLNKLSEARLVLKKMVIKELASLIKEEKKIKKSPKATPGKG
tara:strand:+ start:13977 stop:15233 length:1257 start_codon:yes stop_codon:yes gene_type:complete